MKEKYRWDIENQTKVGKYLTQKESDFIEEFLKNHQVRKCLELGCGSGRFTQKFYGRGIEIIGIDNDRLPLRILHKKLPKVRVLCLDASQELPFPSREFDCLLAMQFVDYIADMPKFLKECSRVLKNKGFFVFTLSNKNSYKKILHSMFGKDRNNYQFSFSQMKHFLSQSGFKIIQSRGYHWVPFYRDSNNKYVNFSSKIESFLNLKKIPAFSPGVMYLAQKK